MEELGLYLQFIKTYMKSKLEYKFSIVVEIFANIINIGGFYVFLTVIFTQVQSIKGWEYYDILFLVSLNWLCNAISGFFFWAPSVRLGEMIRTGTFDTLLVRPIHPLKFYIYRQFQYTFIGRLLIAVFFLIYSLAHLSLNWTFFKAVFFFIVIVSGALIHGALLIIISTTAFWIVSNEDVVNFIASYDGIRTLIDFPLAAFPSFIQVIFTFMLPFAFVNYYPSIYFLNKQESYSLFAPYLQFGSPVVAALLFGVAVLLWNWGLTKYNSAGA
ncbi:ABC-2 family transporter protein [Paenibacillus polymyxa]|uniref:ABC-2 family transporter protein n=1 Tax=Paenibacillus polymyxa TaxID=1406 RepID=A0A8I1J507_PAEPO|nr:MULTISPECIES: ABC-2 family transporter protein [Paenibacillus]KAF6569867.1 ABC-2 family transporter protein [Paenibacillus sp. EKM206P]KAF6585412.1 ABC-2 family transporter protein [Paenibacillus sp. EKM205P]MBM0635689.1 ABC-2 family transporter protein [Paenibacillus polymyxa]